MADEKISDAAAEAFAASGLSKSTLKAYRPRWREWQNWCARNNVNSLAATEENFLKYRTETGLELGLLVNTQAAISVVYRHHGAGNPSSPPKKVTDVTERKHQEWMRRFEYWCRKHDKTSLPADPAAVTEYLRELTTTRPRTDVEWARASISRTHRQAGYPNPTKSPEVFGQIKYKEDSYKKTKLSPTGLAREERLRTRWKRWCEENSIQPTIPEQHELEGYISHLAQERNRSNVNGHVRAIMKMLTNPEITEDPGFKALMKSIPYNGKQRPTSKRREEAEQEIDEIFNIAFTEGAWKEEIPSHLGNERIKRLMTAISSARVKKKTLLGYVAYSWIPFKRWCVELGTTTRDATAADVASFLCEVAERTSSTTANRAHTALLHCYNLTRPDDNPADRKLARTALRGMTRELPEVVDQASAITEKEYQLIRETAGKRRDQERPHISKLRGDTDIAVISVMRDSMLRLEEAAAARWTDVIRLADGRGTLLIRRSKTDQGRRGAEGHLTEQTMRDLDTLIDIRKMNGIETSEDDTIFGLSASAIYKRIKALCDHAGLKGRYSGHSARVGMTQDLVADNIDLPSISSSGRWTSPAMPSYYARKLLPSRNGVAQYNRKKEENAKAGKKRPRKTKNPLEEFNLINRDNEDPAPG